MLPHSVEFIAWVNKIISELGVDVVYNLLPGYFYKNFNSNHAWHLYIEQLKY